MGADRGRPRLYGFALFAVKALVATSPESLLSAANPSDTRSPSEHSDCGGAWAEN
jgi:hypothetical protein